MSFLPPALVESTNRFARSGPEDRPPVFKRNAAGTVHFGGSVLRYSTTTRTAQKGA